MPKITFYGYVWTFGTVAIRLDLASAVLTGAKLVTNCHDLHWLRLKGGASAPHNPHPLNQGIVHLHVLVEAFVTGIKI